MADLEVYGVDFLKGRGHLFFGKPTLKTPAHRLLGESIRIDQIAYIETVSSHTTKDAGAGIGAGILGAALAGTPGFLAGVMLGKSKGQISFVARFNDRRILFATTDHASYNTLLSAAIGNRRMEHDLSAGEPHSTNSPLIELTKQCPSCAETIKLQALKCRFCGEVFDPGEVASIMANQQQDTFKQQSFV